MLDHRKLSSKINYNVLADLFSEDGGEGAPAGSSGGGAGGDWAEGAGGVSAISAALREREESQKQAESRKLARQAEALQADMKSGKYRRREEEGLEGLEAGSGGDSGSKRPAAAPRPRGRALGSLRDANWSSQLRAGGGSNLHATGQGRGSGGKRVRFTDDVADGGGD